MSAEPCLQLGLFARNLEAVFFAEGLELGRLHVIKVILDFLGLSFGFLGGPGAVGLHGVVGNFFPGHLENPNPIGRDTRLFVGGPAKQKRTELDTAGRIEGQPIRTNLLSGPPPNLLHVPGPVLAGLLFDPWQILAGIHLDPPPFHVGQDLSKDPHVHSVVVIEILGLVALDPRHFFEPFLEFLSNEVGAFGVVARVGDPGGAVLGVSLHDLHGRQVHQGSLRSVFAESLNAKDFLHGLFAPFQELVRQSLKRITPALALFGSARVLQPGHVHRVAGKSPAINALVPHDVAIKAVIVPNLEIIGVLEPVLEFLQHTGRIVEIVNPQGRAFFPKAVIKVGARVNRHTRDVAVGDRSYRLEFNVHHFGIARVQDRLVGPVEPFQDNPCFLAGPDNGHAGHPHVVNVKVSLIALLEFDQVLEPLGRVTGTTTEILGPIQGGFRIPIAIRHRAGCQTLQHGCFVRHAQRTLGILNGFGNVVGQNLLISFVIIKRVLLVLWWYKWFVMENVLVHGLWKDACIIFFFVDSVNQCNSFRGSRSQLPQKPSSSLASPGPQGMGLGFLVYQPSTTTARRNQQGSSHGRRRRK